MQHEIKDKDIVTIQPVMGDGSPAQGDATITMEQIAAYVLSKMPKAEKPRAD